MEYEKLEKVKAIYSKHFSLGIIDTSKDEDLLTMMFNLSACYPSPGVQDAMEMIHDYLYTVLVKED